MDAHDAVAELSGDERLEHWAESEIQLRHLVDMLGTTLDHETKSLVLDFADHNEMGLALEWIFDYLVDRGVPVPTEVPPKIQGLADRMSMTSRDWASLCASRG